MRCPSCTKESKNKNICEHCGVNIKVHSQVHMMAARLYNEGLEKAKGRCLSGAIESLNSCISLKKDYIDARNLLGLIYWEVGQVGQATKQWVISSSYKKEDNIATKYLSNMQDNASKLSVYSDAISLYNKALQYIEQGSEDMAIISLRKAVSQNPNYVDAKTLLGLYYIVSNQIDKAKELLDDVLTIDKDNYKANKYMETIKEEIKEQEEEPPKVKKPIKSTIAKPIAPKTANKMIQPKSLGGSILTFVIGAVCMLGIYTTLVLPSQTAKLEEEIRSSQDSQRKLQADVDILVEEKDKKILELEKEKLKLEEENKILQEEKQTQDQVKAFSSAKELAAKRSWIEAAAKLDEIDVKYLDEAMTNEYNTLTKDVYKRAGEQLYNQGFTQYQRKNYEEALELLEKSYKYSKEEYYSDNAVFTIGRCYEDMGDIEQAKQYYKLTVEDYPGTDGAYNAQRRLQ